MPEKISVFEILKNVTRIYVALILLSYGVAIIFLPDFHDFNHQNPGCYWTDALLPYIECRGDFYSVFLKMFLNSWGFIIYAPLLIITWLIFWLRQITVRPRKLEMRKGIFKILAVVFIVLTLTPLVLDLSSYTLPRISLSEPEVISGVLTFVDEPVRCEESARDSRFYRRSRLEKTIGNSRFTMIRDGKDCADSFYHRYKYLGVAKDQEDAYWKLFNNAVLSEGKRLVIEVKPGLFGGYGLAKVLYIEGGEPLESQ